MRAMLISAVLLVAVNDVTYGAEPTNKELAAKVAALEAKLDALLAANKQPALLTASTAQPAQYSVESTCANGSCQVPQYETPRRGLFGRRR